MKRSFFRRRRFLINVPYQLKVGAAYGGSLLAYALLFAFLVFEPLQQEILHSKTIEEQAYLARMFQDFQFRMGPAALLLVLLTGFQAIVASHRVAGPLYRLRKAIETLTTGDFSMRIRLRRFDQFREFEGLVNSLADKLEGDRKLLRSKALELEASLANPGEQVRAREILAELKRGLS